MTHTLKLDGRRFTLFKRADSRDAPWYIRLTIEGKRHTLCLSTNQLDTVGDQIGAEARARAAIREATQGRWRQFIGTIRPSRPQHTIADLFTTYRASAVEAAISTREQNIHALTALLHAAGATDSDHTDRINAALADTWFNTTETDTDQRSAARHKRTRNSRAVQARSLFTPRALLAYRAAGIELPHLADFLLHLKAHRYKVPRKDYAPPSDQIIRATLDTWPQLDRDPFLAVGLALAFGLRAGEIAQARWDWLTTIGGQPFLDTASAIVKNHTGQIRVAALDPFHTTLITRARASNWITQPANHILEAINRNADGPIFRAISAWLRGLGWATTKTNHALREYSGSQVAMKFGIYQASSWLRHSSVQVTEAHYTSFVTAHRIIAPETIGIDWARHAPDFTPVIVAASQ